MRIVQRTRSGSAVSGHDRIPDFNDLGHLLLAKKPRSWSVDTRDSTPDIANTEQDSSTRLQYWRNLASHNQSLVATLDSSDDYRRKITDPDYWRIESEFFEKEYWNVLQGSTQVKKRICTRVKITAANSSNEQVLSVPNAGYYEPGDSSRAKTKRLTARRQASPPLRSLLEPVHAAISKKKHTGRPESTNDSVASSTPLGRILRSQNTRIRTLQSKGNASRSLRAQSTSKIAKKKPRGKPVPRPWLVTTRSGRASKISDKFCPG